MRILGIDYGDSRVGVAITDKLQITAQGLETIERKNSDKIVLKRLEEIILQYKDIYVIVVGMPLNMSGEETVRADVTNKFIHKLKCKFNNIKIETMDERLTTVAAHKTMNDLGVKSSKKRSIVDTISAQFILEMYLNRLQNFKK